MKRIVGSGIGLIILVIAGLGYIMFANNAKNVTQSAPIVTQTQLVGHPMSKSQKEQVKNVVSELGLVQKAEAQVMAVEEGISPNKIIIPAINVAAPVWAMGLDEGRMAVPNNFTHVGWYKLGAQPGEKGSAVMGAHVDNGGTIKGVFKNLKRLQVGDDIYVTDANNHALHFKITERKIYPYRTQITDYVFQRNDTARLNLITCYGNFLKKENTYDKRLVIFAELVTQEM
jgi:LPXTG-site transpeptidase (sortase) family protein